MMIARWTIEARFGHKQDVVDSMRKWMREVGSQIGWTEDRARLLTGSVGALESTVVSEIEVESLADLDAAWKKLAGIEAHARWSRELEPHVVSGTNRWEILRVL